MEARRPEMVLRSDFTLLFVKNKVLHRLGVDCFANPTTRKNPTRVVREKVKRMIVHWLLAHHVCLTQKNNPFQRCWINILEVRRPKMILRSD